jgi:hypothetical protein
VSDRYPGIRRDPDTGPPWHQSDPDPIGRAAFACMVLNVTDHCAVAEW